MTHTALPHAPMPTRRFLQTVGGLFVGALLAACGKQEPPPAAPAAASEPVVAAAPAPPPAKVYAVGTDAAYAPFELQNEKGEIVGFTVDVLSAAAAKAGVDIKFVNTPWEGIFNSLAGGERDLLASSITITDERKQTMDFTDSYFDAVQLIAVKGSSKISTFERTCVPARSKTTGGSVIVSTGKMPSRTSAGMTSSRRLSAAGPAGTSATIRPPLARCFDALTTCS